MAQLSAACAVRTAKQELRKALRSVLAAMTEQQRREESEVLVRKVDGAAGGEGGGVRAEGVGKGREEAAKMLRMLAYVTAGWVIASFDPSPMQLFASEEYQSSKRISVYLSMPTEVDTEPVLKVRPLKNAQNRPELTLSFTVGHFQQWEVSGWLITFISQRSCLMNTIFSLSGKVVFCALL